MTICFWFLKVTNLVQELNIMEEKHQKPENDGQYQRCMPENLVTIVIVWSIKCLRVALNGAGATYCVLSKYDTYFFLLLRKLL